MFFVIIYFDMRYNNFPREVLNLSFGNTCLSVYVCAGECVLLYVQDKDLPYLYGLTADL